MSKIFLYLFCSLILVVFGKHMHPKSTLVSVEEEIQDVKNIPTPIEGMPLEVIRHMKHSRFVPVNNVLFFQRFPPCQEGFERDLLGVCREVWE